MGAKFLFSDLSTRRPPLPVIHSESDKQPTGWPRRWQWHIRDEPESFLSHRLVCSLICVRNSGVHDNAPSLPPATDASRPRANVPKAGGCSWLVQSSLPSQWCGTVYMRGQMRSWGPSRPHTAGGSTRGGHLSCPRSTAVDRAKTGLPKFKSQLRRRRWSRAPRDCRCRRGENGRADLASVSPNPAWDEIRCDRQAAWRAQTSICPDLSEREGRAVLA